MALRCDDPERVISALRPRLRQSANWSTGLAAVEAQMERRVFVSPALEGWVLAVGGPETLQEELAVEFPQAQWFMSHRTSGCFGWALYENGHCRPAVRLSGRAGGEHGRTDVPGAGSGL